MSGTHDFRHGSTVVTEIYADPVTRMTGEWVGLIAAGAAWLSAGVAATSGLVQVPSALWLIAYLGFGACYFYLAWPRTDEAPPRGWGVLLAGQAGFGLILYRADPVGFAGIMLVLSAVLLASYLPIRVAIVGVLAQTVAAAALGWREHHTISILAVMALSYLGFQLFAVLMVASLQRAEDARRDAEQAQTALRSAQSRLAARSRDEERLRIARDLHDSLGHQLTALAVNLDVASRTNPQLTQVAVCRDLARGLLADVRDVVGQLREPSTAPLAGRLSALAGTVTRPKVHVQVNGADPRPDIAEAVARLVQESLTNATRHSGADNLWVGVQCSSETVAVQVRDDGQGTDPVVPGHGLRGMSERFAVLGGGVTWRSAPGAGFVIEAEVPG